MDLQLRRGRHAGVAALGVFLRLWCVAGSGCQMQPPAEALVIAFDLREYAYSELAAADAHRSGSERRSGARLVAWQRLSVTPPRMHVDATSQLMDDPGAPRVHTVTLYDWQRGAVWSATEGKPATRRLTAELDYDEANLYRRNQLDFTTAYVESAAVRDMPDVELFLGDGRMEDLGLAMFAGRKARVFRVALVPGAYWEVWVLPGEVTPFEAPWQTHAYLVGAMGVSPSTAGRILDLISGIPVKITVTVYSSVDARILIEGYLQDVSWRSDPGDEPAAFSGLRLDSDIDEQLRDVDFLLDSVRHLDQLSTGLTPTAVFLKLSEHMTDMRLGAALELFPELDNAYAQVELARALLRYRADPVWTRLRDHLFLDNAATAMNLVEALVAQDDARALSALMYVLSRRQEFDDTAPEVVVDWGLSHLRVLTGMSLAELVEYSASETEIAEPEPAAAARSAELARWLRWWNEKQASVPRF